MLAILIAVSACGGEADESQAPEQPEPDGSLVGATPKARSESEAQVAAVAAERAAPDVDGVVSSSTDGVVGPFDGLVVGDCWNVRDVVDDSASRVSDSVTSEALPSAPVSCDAPHQHETFALGELSDVAGAPYPGLLELERRSFEEFCDAAALEFVGEPSAFAPAQIWSWFPSGSAWDGGDRTVVCSVGVASGAAKTGTARGGSLDSDDSLIIRASARGMTDWFLTSERGSLLPLTEGAFDLPLAPPDVLEVGLLFAAPMRDATTDSADHFTLVDFDDLSVLGRIDLDGLEGWQVADPQLTSADPAVVFAARENDDSDWDLYRARGSEVERLTESDGDERWPRILPDERGVVYNADGAIWIMEIDGQNQRAVTEGRVDYEPAVSPDGTQIVFTSGRSGDEEIWIVNVDGTGLANLTDHPANDSFPFWSSDGDLVYFQSDRLGDGSHIMMMTADGANASYFGREKATAGAVVPPSVGASLAAQLGPLDVPVRFDRIEGLPGQLGRHGVGEGRLEVALPVGWDVAELRADPTADGAVAELVASSDLDRYFDRWEVDGVAITLVAGEEELFRARIEQTDASVCRLEERAESERVTNQELRLVTIRRYDCLVGPAWVVAEWSTERSLGVVYEFQGPYWSADALGASDADSPDPISPVVESARWN